MVEPLPGRPWILDTGPPLAWRTGVYPYILPAISSDPTYVADP